MSRYKDKVTRGPVHVLSCPKWRDAMKMVARTCETDWNRAREAGLASVKKAEDAELFAEAVNVLHETGLTPRELAEQRAELLAALKGFMSIVSDSRGVDGYHLNGNVAEWDEFEEVADAEASFAACGVKP